MGIVDVFFTPSILITLAVCLILISVLGLYFIQKINQQNHKINTMVDLVSTLSEQMGVMRGLQNREQMAGMPGQMGGIDKHPNFSTEPNANVELSQANELHTVNMIHVSDGEDEDSKVEYDEEDESEDEEDSDDEEEEEGEGENEPKILKNLVEDEALEIPDLSVDEVDENPGEEDCDEESDSKIKSLDVVMDYKKASLSKLRDLVQSKGLVTDASKMKKSDILKVLDSE